LVLGAVLAKHLTAPPEIRDGWRRGVFVAAAVVLFLAYEMVKHVNGNVMPGKLIPR